MNDPNARVERLTAADYDAVVEHLTVTFGEKDFAELLPGLYEPTDRSMRCNFALRRNGRIAAIVGMFPRQWKVGDTTLRLAGIGGVSVHPDFAGQGLMRVLMDAVMIEIEAEGFHAAYLGGARHRYAHWGFETAGCDAVVRISTNGLRHILGGDALERSVELSPPTDDDSAALLRLYDTMPLRCVRSVKRVPPLLRNWRNQTLVLRDDHGKPQAYGVFKPDTHQFVELLAADKDALDRFLIAATVRQGKAITVQLPPLRTPRFDRLLELGDGFTVIESGNWRLYDWPAVIGASMRLRHGHEPLAPGSAVLSLTDLGRSIRLSVSDGGATCAWTTDAADVSLTSARAIQLLTGPLPPAVPLAAADLLRWRPLPMSLPTQDRI